MTARQHFTRWERDRLGRLVLRQRSYRVLGRPYVLERGLALRDAALTTLVSALWFAVVFVLALVATGCAGAELPAERALVFSPEPELEEMTRQWAERWSAATGVELAVGPGGIAVRAFEHEKLCGTDTVTSVSGVRVKDLVEVDLTPREGCPGWGYALGHEMGHAIGAIGHAPSGIMGVIGPGEAYVIDDASLEQVCAVLDCTAFQPEPLVCPGSTGPAEGFCALPSHLYGGGDCNNWVPCALLEE